MSAKKQSSLTEAVRNAATGYAVVVLGIICFLLALILLMAGVRLVAGWGYQATSSTTNATTTQTVQTTAAGRSA